MKIKEAKEKMRRYFELQELAYKEIVDTGNSRSAQRYIEEQDEIRYELEFWCGYEVKI